MTALPAEVQCEADPATGRVLVRMDVAGDTRAEQALEGVEPHAVRRIQGVALFRSRCPDSRECFRHILVLCGDT